MSQHLSGKTVLVTAGAHGLGAATVRTPAARGANVACGRIDDPPRSQVGFAGFWAVTSAGSSIDVGGSCNA